MCMADNENIMQDAAVIEEPQSAEEVAAHTLMENLNNIGEQEENQQEEAQEPEQEEAHEDNPYTSGIQTLYEDGWSEENIAALITDPTALRDIQGGKTVRQAAFAFMHRQMQGASTKNTKKSVPTLKNPATSGAKVPNKIETMSDEEFARFSDRMYEEAMSGKRIRI